MPGPTVNVRYLVDDVEAAVAFYTTHLGFTLLSNAAPAFADVRLGDLRLLLSGPTSSARWLAPCATWVSMPTVSSVAGTVKVVAGADDMAAMTFVAYDLAPWASLNWYSRTVTSSAVVGRCQARTKPPMSPVSAKT